MKSIGYLGAMAMTLVLLDSPDAAARQPLRMDLAPLAANAAPASSAPAPRSLARRSFTAPAPTVAERDLRLTDRKHARQEALSTLGVGLLSAPEPMDEPTVNEPVVAGQPSFKFNKQGHIARDLRRGYRRMGERLADRVFDEPRGKRIVFDVAGKPGVGVEIPIR